MANPEDLGRYRLTRLLGRGAMGEVWEANDNVSDGAKVALKIMHAADEELLSARIHFAREARLAAQLRHPHVVNVRDAGEAAGTSFMVMEMVEGPSLRSAVAEGATTLDEKLRWIAQVGAALAALHRAGIAHRDVKPENVIVRADRTACLVDLGIAKWAKFDNQGQRDSQVDLEEIEAVSGPAQPTEYVPPETTTDNVYDELGDQYAWGVLAYEVLTGELPRDGSIPLVERVTIPRQAAEAIDRARSSRRAERWGAMSDLVARLVAATDDPELVRSPSSPPHDAPTTKPPPPSTGPATSAPASALLATSGDVPAFVVVVAVVFVALVMAVLFGLR
jgi:serine/threonine-protein kinase